MFGKHSFAALSITHCQITSRFVHSKVSDMYTLIDTIDIPFIGVINVSKSGY